MNLVKKLFLISLLFIANSSFAFGLYGRCIANPSVATCFVSNNLPQPILCEIFVTGISASGARAYVNNVALIYPGMWEELYVYAFNPFYDPMISASYYANCRY